MPNCIKNSFLEPIFKIQAAIPRGSSIQPVAGGRVTLQTLQKAASQGWGPWHCQNAVADPVTLLLPLNRHLISVLMRGISGAASLYSENKRQVL